MKLKRGQIQQEERKIDSREIEGNSNYVKAENNTQVRVKVECRRINK
jgi:hypothetical protein